MVCIVFQIFQCGEQLRCGMILETEVDVKAVGRPIVLSVDSIQWRLFLQVCAVPYMWWLSVAAAVLDSIRQEKMAERLFQI